MNDKKDERNIDIVIEHYTDRFKEIDRRQDYDAMRTLAHILIDHLRKERKDNCDIKKQYKFNSAFPFF